MTKSKLVGWVAFVAACGGPDGDADSDASSDGSSATTPSTSASDSLTGSGEGNGGPPLEIDIPTDAPACVRGGESLHDYIVPGTGNGTAIACSRGNGNGEGTLPAAMSIDPTTCEVVGTLPADRYGTWVVIVKATQSGTELFVPYCITQDQKPEGDAIVEVITAAGGTADTALLPLHGTFAPSAPLAMGTAGDPIVRITDAERCGPLCSYSYGFFVTKSPFDVASDPFIVDLMQVEIEGRPAGISHGLDLVGPAVADGAPTLSARPWVLGLTLDYCLASNPNGCDGDPAPVARFQYSILMTPE